jgi:hypothetical protein
MGKHQWRFDDRDFQAFIATFDDLRQAAKRVAYRKSPGKSPTVILPRCERSLNETS